jgi:hypothetical protein
MIQGSGRCSYHPERVGVGICVECRKVICVECTTQFEGINRCARCLALKLQKSTRLAGRREWTVGNVFWVLVSLASVFGGVYLVASLLGSRS